jgi:hypothetical protein
LQPDALACLILLGLCSIWLLTLRLPFIALDDPVFVIENTYVQGGLTHDAIVWSFTTHAGDYWHPLTWISLALDTTLFGAAPWGYHLTNALLHTANTLLVYTLLRITTGSVWRSALAAALFSLHPQRVESVAWVTERKDVLAGFFGLLAVIAYIRFTQRPQSARYLLICVLTICSLLSKPIFVTLPALLLILDFWPLQRLNRKKLWPILREKIPLILICAAASLNTYLYVHGGPALRGTFASSVANCFRNYVIYLREAIYPGGLALFHRSDQATLLSASAAALLLAAITAAIFWSLRRQHRPAPALAAGWLWFLIALFPVSGIIQAGYSMQGDRFTYIPALGLIVLAVWGMSEAVPRHNRLVFAAGCIAVAALSIHTVHRLNLWKDPLALYLHDLTLNPDNAYLHQLAGLAARDRGRNDLAHHHLRRATELEPRDFLEGHLLHQPAAANPAATKRSH